MSICIIMFDSSLGTAICEDLIRTSLSIVEVLSQHHALISPYPSDVSICGRKYATLYPIKWMVECAFVVGFWLATCLTDWLSADSLVHRYRTGILWYSTNVSTFPLTGRWRQPVIILLFCISATVRFSASIFPFSHLEKNVICKLLC